MQYLNYQKFWNTQENELEPSMNEGCTNNTANLLTYTVYYQSPDWD